MKHITHSSRALLVQRLVICERKQMKGKIMQINIIPERLIDNHVTLVKGKYSVGGGEF